MSGSTNFLVFNPTNTTNTDDDATYAAQSQRTGGLVNGIAITSMHNKLFRQTSVMAAAIAQVMANSSGQTVNDVDVAALATVITNSFAVKDASGNVSGKNFMPTGLPGATLASRYAGATLSGAPTSGTFIIGDFIIDLTGNIWICTSTGTPGTWVSLASMGYQEITSTSTFTVPPRVSRLYIQSIGGGGGGCGGPAADGTALIGGNPGGGAAGYAGGWVSVTPAQQITVTIGAGGAGGASGGYSGYGGGTTTFLNMVAYGGGGGNVSAGGTGTGGNRAISIVTGGSGTKWSSYDRSGAPGGLAANNTFSAGYGNGGTGGSGTDGYGGAGSAGSPGNGGAVIIIW